MITKVGKALAVMGVLALLAMPARALAHDEQSKSHHEHKPDHGRHLGWDKHHHDGDRDEWYQGQRGQWHHEGKQWQWKGYEGDEWYQGQRGHWYREGNRWQWRGDGGDRDYDKDNRAHHSMSSAQLQRRRALVNQDRTDRARYRAALKRGDKEAAEHYLKQLNSTDKLLGMTQQQINAGMLPYADGHIGK